MRTDQRLTKAYKSARVDQIDKDSKYIFFSDAHRGDNSLSDEFSRNQNIFQFALEYYFGRGFVYVEAGDGDELWEYSHFKHIRLAYSDIFALLKRYFDEDRMIMLYGNHNLFLKHEGYLRSHYDHYYDNYNEEEIELFHGIITYEALVLKHKETGQEILTVHGHQGDFSNDQIWFGSMLLMRYFWRFMHLIGFQNPSSPAKNVHKMHKIEKNYNKWIEKHQIMMICGHTHRPKFPKLEELPYFNTGCCVHNKGITGIEIENDSISLVHWKINADNEGNLKIDRAVLRGPQPLELFDRTKNLMASI
ncbi:MAG: hypothetical protein Q7I98_05605 [Erysipelotrichaceae bacterium]|nr:hypothetical protein [Erysipelotrichaceae bacterium]